MPINNNGKPWFHTIEGVAQAAGYTPPPARVEKTDWEASAKRVLLIQQFHAAELALKHLHLLKSVIGKDFVTADREIERMIQEVTLLRQAIGTKYGEEALKRDSGTEGPATYGPELG